MKAFLLSAFVALSLFATNAEALKLDQDGCLVYAIWARDVVWARDVGADKDRVRASLEEMGEREKNPVFALLLRFFDPLWGTGMPKEMIAQSVYTECAGRRGEYGKGA